MSYTTGVGRGDAKHSSLDSEPARGHDILKGGIVVGTIAGDEARQATENEHNLSFRDAVRLYPASIGWSVFFSLGIIMTGISLFGPCGEAID